MISGMRKLRAKEIKDSCPVPRLVRSRDLKRGLLITQAGRVGGAVLLLHTAGPELLEHLVLPQVLKREKGFGGCVELIKM